MTPLFPAQRAAEEFDGVLDGRATPQVAERYAGLVSTVQVLRDQPEVMPRAEFVTDLRGQLMALAEAEMVPTTPVVRRLPTSTSRRTRRLGTVAAALVIVGGSAGMAAAAEGALPGQPLYPVKRGVEQVTIAAHFGNAAKGGALLDQADERLDELQELVASGSTDTALLDSTVSDFQSSADSGADKLFLAYRSDGDAADVTQVRDFAAHAMGQVGSMADGADPSVVSRLRDSADVLADLDQQAATLCSTCGDSSVSLPPSLVSASGAAAVTNLIARPAKQAGLDVIRAREIRDAAERQRIDGLKNAAQGAADALGAASSGTSGSGKGAAAAAATQPLTSTLDSTGKLVPSLTTAGGSAVKNLVGGLTGTVTQVTGTSGQASGLGKTVKDTGDAVGKTVDGVTGAVNGTVEGLTKNLKPHQDK